ncbi:MAG TPA: glycosyltransferase family 39 protein [Blastocatellia bacterium]|nr:glycosyltransferase family 39 protein [Blastocatellia bacterium]
MSALKSSVPLLITVIAGLGCYGLFVRRSVWLSVVGYSISPAERVLHGEVPYRDFLYNYTPGTLWLNAVLMKLFGSTLMTVNAGLFVFKVATLVTLFYVTRRLTNEWVALVPVALTLAWLGHQYIFGVVPTQYSLLFVLVGMGLMLTYDRSGRLGWLFLSGLAIGIVLTFKYNVGLLLLAAGTGSIAAREVIGRNGEATLSRRVLMAAGRSAIYWAGFGVVVAALMAYMASNGALSAMINHFLHHAAEYSESRSVPLPRPKQLLPVIAGLLVVVAGGYLVIRRAPKLFSAYVIGVIALGSGVLLVPGRAYILKQSAAAAVAYLPLALFAAIVLLVGWRFARSPGGAEDRQQWWRTYGAIITVGLFTLGAYLEMYPRADEYHLVRVLPPVFLLLVLFIHLTLPAVTSSFRHYVEGPSRPALLTVSVPLVLLVVAGVYGTWRPHFDGRFNFRDRKPLSIERARGMLVSARQAEFIEGLARSIEENSSPDDYIFSFAQRGSGFYFLSGRRNPTRFVWWRSVGIDGQDREAVLEMIADRRPRLILLQDSLTNKRVRETVISNYHQVSAVTDIAVYERNQ